MTRPLPPMRPCSCGMRPRTNRWMREWNVVCYSCDRRGAAKKTRRASIESWNDDWNRRDTTEAERRGAMAALGYLDNCDGEPFAFAADALRLAIETGEVIPKREAKPERTTKRGWQEGRKP